MIGRKLLLRSAALATAIGALMAWEVGPASAAGPLGQHAMNDFVFREGWGMVLQAKNDFLVIQDDGNVVLYNWNQRPIWASNTFNAPNQSNELAAQSDGNLVIYSVSGNTRHAIWSTGTWGHRGSRLVLQQDGNLVIYDDIGRALWGSGTNYWPGCGNGC